jgi:hypothetical protein
VQGSDDGHRHRAAAVAGALLAAAIAVPAAPAATYDLAGDASSLLAPVPLGQSLATPSVPPRLPGRVVSAERVLVQVGPSGAVRSVAVEQRLDLRGTGDFVFAIPAPATDAVPLEGSGSLPGLRAGQVIWQGFASGRKTLAARVALRPAEAVAALPLRVRLAVRVAGHDLGERPASGPLELTLDLVDAAVARGDAPVGSASPGSAAAALDTLRAAARAGALPGSVVVETPRDPDVAATPAAAPLEVRGTLRFAAGSVALAAADGARIEPGGAGIAFAATLADGAPTALRIRVTGSARGAIPPRLALVATPRPPLRTLQPPGAATWRALARAGALGGRDGLARSAAALAAFTLAARYGAFLANPDPGGPSQAVYAFASAPAARPARARDGGGHGPLAWAAGAALALVAAGAALVAWSRS